MAPSHPQDLQELAGQSWAKRKWEEAEFIPMAGMLIQAGGGACTAAGSPPALSL